MRKTLLLLLPLLAACASTPAETAPAPAAQTFGAPLAQGEAVPAAKLLAQPELYDGRTLTVEARVAEVCPKKGCWMIVREGEQSMRVTFKDYGFFVPKDSAGRTARMQGEFRVTETPVDLARHYLEDAGRHEDALKITAPVRTLSFVASGVELSER